MQHCAILQGGRSDGGDIEGLLAFGFTDRCTEVSKSPDCGIIHHKHGSGLFVCPGHTYDRFFYVVSQFLRSRNIAARLFHIPTVLLIWPYVLSQQASARVPPRSSEAPVFSSGLQPFVQFVAIYEQMLPLLDDRYPSVFGLVIEG